MGYYSGYFRSLDETVDPNGQLYKVLIFTGYNPLALNTQTIGGTNSINLGPYPYVNKLVGFARTAGDETHPGELVPVYRNVPVRATELTMSDHPFVVNYVGDGLEKPYPVLHSQELELSPVWPMPPHNHYYGQSITTFHFGVRSFIIYS